MGPNRQSYPNRHRRHHAAEKVLEAAYPCPLDVSVSLRNWGLVRRRHHHHHHCCRHLVGCVDRFYIKLMIYVRGTHACQLLRHEIYININNSHTPQYKTCKPCNKYSYSLHTKLLPALPSHTQLLPPSIIPQLLTPSARGGCLNVVIFVVRFGGRG